MLGDRGAEAGKGGGRRGVGAPGTDGARTCGGLRRRGRRRTCRGLRQGLGEMGKVVEETARRRGLGGGRMWG